MYYKLTIKQVCRATPAAEPYNVWEYVNEKFAEISDVRDRLTEIYGKVPYIKGNEIYRDAKEPGAPAVHVGYHYSYWEDLYDRNNPGKKYFATDWIEIKAVIEESIILQTDKPKDKEAA